MTVQRSTAARNNALDSFETTVGTAAKIRILTGTQPATCATAESGSLLVSYTLASDWAAAASGGSKAFSSTPIAGTASGTGTAGYYRITDNAGTTCHEQGSVGTSGTDAIIDNASIVNGQTVNITGWTVTAAGA